MLKNRFSRICVFVAALSLLTAFAMPVFADTDNTPHIPAGLESTLGDLDGDGWIEDNDDGTDDSLMSYADIDGQDIIMLSGSSPLSGTETTPGSSATSDITTPGGESSSIPESSAGPTTGMPATTRPLTSNAPVTTGTDNGEDGGFNWVGLIVGLLIAAAVILLVILLIPKKQNDETNK